MLRAVPFALVALLPISPSFAQVQPAEATPQAAPALQKRLTPVTFEQLKLLDGTFWSNRLDLNRKVTLPLCLEKCAASGRLDNFVLASGQGKGEHKGPAWSDAEVYQVIEAAACALAQSPDPALEARIDAIIDTIAAAQRPDGYLNTNPALSAPEKRWADMANGYELQCAGQLIEAAVAYQRATRKTKLLDVARKFADHIDQVFGPGKKLDPCGHPKIEPALCKLFESTGEARYLALAKFFVGTRGNLTGRTGLGEAAQDAKPLSQQTVLVGDPAGAMALYSGAAEISRLIKDDALVPALETIWKDVVAHRLSITGGISGARASDPSNETRASIAMAEWNQSMLLATGDPKYADIVDLEIHNAIQASVSHKGDAFFQANPLASQGDQQRSGWYEGAGTPGDIAGFMSSVPGLVFSTIGNSIYISQYIPCKADIVVAGVVVHIKMETQWPFNGFVELAVNPEQPITFAIKFRRPAWCKTVVYVHDMKEKEHSTDYPGTEAGWETYERRYEPNDGCKINLLGPVRREYGPQVAADAGRVAVCRGPLVYTIEGLDNRGSAQAWALPPTASLSAVRKADSLVLGATVGFKSKAGQFVDRGPDGTPLMRPADIEFIPYFQWGNRGQSDMSVWVPETPDKATPMERKSAEAKPSK